MKREIYDKVGEVSVLLKEKLVVLEKCQKEKEEILKWAGELLKNELTIEQIKEIERRTEDNLKEFEKVVEEIKMINSSFSD